MLFQKRVVRINFDIYVFIGKNIALNWQKFDNSILILISYIYLFSKQSWYLFVDALKFEIKDIAHQIVDWNVLIDCKLRAATTVHVQHFPR